MLSELDKQLRKNAVFGIVANWDDGSRAHWAHNYFHATSEEKAEMEDHVIEFHTEKLRIANGGTGHREVLYGP